MKKTVLLLLTIFWNTLTSLAQFQVGGITVTPTTLATNLQVPWELVWGPDNFIWMTERYGRISRVNPANGQVQPLVTIPDVLETGESGLLGMVLHPDFRQNPHVFVAYTYSKNGTTTEKLVRYTFTGTSLTSPQIILDNIAAASIHDGSRLLILPDRTLLMTTGEAGNYQAAQDLNSLNGKILRLNLDGSIPANNPIPGSYIYSFGHRNAQGLVRAGNGKIYSSEHGPSSDDELNLIEPNRNYGWQPVMGFCNTSAEQTFCTANNVKEPIAAWTPTLAVAGIAFYDHPAIPAWQNSVLMTTLKANQLVQVKLNAAGTTVTSQSVFLNGVYGRLRSICVSPAGKVYIGTSNRDGRGSPTTTDDRIIVLENLAFNPTGTTETFGSGDILIDVFPDRANSKIHVKFPVGFEGKRVTLHTISGKLVAEKIIPQNRQTAFNTKELAEGIYLIRAQNQVRKVILP